MGHLHAVLLATELVDHVVGHGAVFIDGLGAAVLHGLHLRCRGAFNAVPQNGAADDADHGGSRVARALAKLVANGASRQSTHQGACP